MEDKKSSEVIVKRLEKKKEKYWCPTCGDVVEKYTYYFVHAATGAIIKYHDSANLPVDKRLEMSRVHRCLHKKEEEMEISIGNLLKEVRIKCGVTLRTFCFGRELDPVRFSMIERDILKPNDTEVNEYLSLVAELGKLEETKEVNLELKPFLDKLHYCMSCGRTVVSTIYGLFEKRTGGLVNIITGHEQPFTCKPCQKRIDAVGKKKETLLTVKEMAEGMYRMFAAIKKMTKSTDEVYEALVKK